MARFDLVWFWFDEILQLALCDDQHHWWWNISIEQQTPKWIHIGLTLNGMIGVWRWKCKTTFPVRLFVHSRALNCRESTLRKPKVANVCECVCVDVFLCQISAKYVWLLNKLKGTLFYSTLFDLAWLDLEPRVWDWNGPNVRTKK